MKKMALEILPEGLRLAALSTSENAGSASENQGQRCYQRSPEWLFGCVIGDNGENRSPTRKPATNW